MTEPDISQQLETPLALLKSIADSTLAGGQTLSQTQLQQQLAELQSAVSEVLDIVANALNDLLAQFEDDLSLSESSLKVASAELRAISEDIDEHLGSLSDVLLGAQDFAELGDARAQIEAVGGDMQATFARLAVLFDALLDASLEESLEEVRHREETLAVAALLVSALDSLDGHLNDNDPNHLRDAFAQVDDAFARLAGLLA